MSTEVIDDDGTEDPMGLEGVNYDTSTPLFRAFISLDDLSYHLRNGCSESQEIFKDDVESPLGHIFFQGQYRITESTRVSFDLRNDLEKNIDFGETIFNKWFFHKKGIYLMNNSMNNCDVYIVYRLLFLSSEFTSPFLVRIQASSIIRKDSFRESFVIIRLLANCASSDFDETISW